jgi:hypothetical protein
VQLFGAVAFVDAVAAPTGATACIGATLALADLGAVAGTPTIGDTATVGLSALIATPCVVAGIVGITTLLGAACCADDDEANAKSAKVIAKRVVLSCFIVLCSKFFVLCYNPIWPNHVAKTTFVSPLWIEVSNDSAYRHDR